MRRDPLLLITVTLTLAVAIGAGTTVFSLVDSILLRPLSFPDSGRVYWLAERSARTALDAGFGPDYYSLRERKQVFAEVGAYDTSTLNWSDAGRRPEQLDSTSASPSFFSALATRPLLGRYFDESEQGPKAPPLVVLSYAFWRTRLNQDPAVLSRSLTLDGVPHRVIGVMPQGFGYPRDTQVWTPMAMDDASQRPRSPMRPFRLIRMIARVRPELDDARVQAMLPTLSRSILAEYPSGFAGAGFLDDFSVVAEPLQRRITGDVRPVLYALSAAVLLVILIACANLANLLLARAAARRREFGIRLALGADRLRLARQLLVESCRLALPGGAAGILLAAIVVRILNAVQPLALARYPEILLDQRTLLFTFTLTLLTALAFGMAPVLSAGATDPQEAMKSGGAGAGSSRAARAARRLLVTAELAVSLVLLIGAGLLARSFLNLSRVHPGFRPEGLLTLRVNLTGPRYASPSELQRYYRETLAAVAALPGVSAAAVTTDLPLTGEHAWQSGAVQVAGRVPVPPSQRPQSDVTIVSEDYFRALGVPLRAGRLFDSRDTDNAPGAVVVNEAFARKVFPGETALGRVLLTGRPGQEQRWNIVGIVGDVRANSLGAEPTPVLFRCLCQQSGNRFLARMGFLVRTGSDPVSEARAVASRLYSVDAAEPVFDVKSMQDRVAATLAPERFQLWLIGGFTLIAIVLAAVGVYGVMACLVTQRTREIGIRIAIGARPAQVQRLVLGETVVLAALAAIAGVVAAWGLTRYLASMLYGVTTRDLPAFAIAPLLLIAVALAASIVPARRAATVDPQIALREE